MQETTHDAKTRLREMADHLEPMPNHYDGNGILRDDTVNMGAWLGLPDEDCGTAGCVAGHTVLKYDGPEKTTDRLFDFGRRAAFLLGICAEEEDYNVHMGEPVWRRTIIARSLFHPPEEVNGGVRTIDGAQCAKVLRWLADNIDDEAITAAAVRLAWLEATDTPEAITDAHVLLP